MPTRNPPTADSTIAEYTAAIAKMTPEKRRAACAARLAETERLLIRAERGERAAIRDLDLETVTAAGVRRIIEWLRAVAETGEPPAWAEAA